MVSFLPTARFRKGRRLAIGERWRTVLNRPSLSDHRFSHGPLTAFQSVGFFVSRNCREMRHLRGFSVLVSSPAENGEKAVSDASTASFLPVFSV